MFTANSKNFITDQTGMIQKRQGGVQWNRTSFSEAAKDTYEAVFESGARHFLRIGGGVLSASTGTGLFDVITSGYSTIGNFEWATYQNRTYGCNGVNAPQTYDIATSYGGVTYTFTTGKTKDMGAQAPSSAPTSGAYTAGGSVPDGSHRYKITFVYYESEESNGSTASSIQTAGAGNNTGHLSAIPIGGYGVTARNIYRDNNDGVYLLLDTISNNTATTYTDTLLIGSTPTPIPTFNDVPPTFSKIALWLDSIFIAPSGETNLIRYSNTGTPDIFDPSNFIICQSDDVITALYVYNGKLYVFGLHSFGSIEGNTPDTFYYHNISNLIGCVDNRSIQVRSIVSVPTLWWLSDKGLYYSNGNTVEYGSDYIQDLVNLNIAQVNYSTNKNTQTSFADFSGDTSTSGIDITSQPGSVTTLNPTKVYSTTADWLGGSSLTNIRTSDGTFAEIPTKQERSLASGVLSGSAIISGVNLTLPSTIDFMGETHAEEGVTTGRANTNIATSVNEMAQPFFPDRSCTLTDVTIPFFHTGTQTSWRFTLYADSLGAPGSPIYTQGFVVTVSNPNLDISFVLNLSGLSIALTGGTRYWLAVGGIDINGNIGKVRFSSGWSSGSSAYARRGNAFTGTWDRLSDSSSSFFYQIAASYAVVSDPIASNGTWTAPIFDNGNSSAVGQYVAVVSSIPADTAGSIIVYASQNADMSFSATQSFPLPIGLGSVTLSGYRYWRLVVSLSTTNNIRVPVIGVPFLTFSETAEWISQPIDTTTDNTGWGTLSYTGNVPFGTSSTLTIATSSNNITYSSYGPIGSALVERWAKVRLVLTSSIGNDVSPSIISITLNWSLSSSITSSIIDTGITPAGFGVAQWEQISLTAGTVTFYIRTAATSGAIPAASFVSVANGAFPNLSALRFVQWKIILTSTANNSPVITSVTVNWYTSSGAVSVRCASLFYNKTYYLSVATLGSTANNTIIQLDQFGKWRIQKDTSVGCFLSYFNTLYFTDGTSGLIFNGFIADTDNGTAITMDVRTKAWNAENDLFLKVPRAFKVTGLHTGTTLHAYYSPDRGTTWIEMLNENGQTSFITNTGGTEFIVLFVPDGATLNSGRTLMYRLVSSDVFPCSIINYVPSFYSRKGRYLSNG
jgi:hypothetical protein